MAAPYNYDYILKYIIIGDQGMVHIFELYHSSDLIFEP